MRPAPRTVLVVVTRQIGDVLLTTPLLRQARQLWPQAQIDVLGFEGTLAILRGNPDVNELIPMGSGSGWKTLRGLAGRIWRRYDLAVVAEISDRAHLAGWLASSQRVGLLPPAGESGGRRIKGALLAHAVRSGGDRSALHVVEEKLRLLDPWRAAGAGGESVSVRAPPMHPLPPTLERRLVRRRYVVVHSPSMWTYKQWPPASFQCLIQLLAEQGHQVVLSGGPDAGDRALVKALSDSSAGTAIDAGVLSFGQLSSLLAGARLYVGPDTSVSHLAAATGIPVIAIFGPTNPQRWAPWPAGAARTTQFCRAAPRQQVGNVTLIQAQHACIPCGRAGCEDNRDSRSVCLLRIAPERVAEAAMDLLSLDVTAVRASG